MDDKMNAASSSYIVVSEEKTTSLYPMYFCVSCAFVALRLLKKPQEEDEKWCELRDKMLQGSAQLLGLLVWRIQREEAEEEKHELLRKLANAEKEIEKLKKMRHEDAKANEKVVGIFASQEQNWLNERKKLRLQMGALMKEMRVMEQKRKEAIPELEEKLKETELLVQTKDKVIEQEEQKMKELEEKLAKAESEAQELRENAKKLAQEHSAELWKQKTAFIELVSNQRRLEAELGRTVKQVEGERQELELAIEQKEESELLAQKLSAEIVKMRNDLEQKDQILSAMLRKSKLDTAEKQMLSKEFKLSKAKRKQVEIEMEKWRVASESRRRERHSLRSMFAIETKSRGSSNVTKTSSQIADPATAYEHHGLTKDPEVVSDMVDSYSVGEIRELVLAGGVRKPESWVCGGTESYLSAMGKRHHMELDAFAEQLRLKDEKLEALCWRLMTTDLESKRLESYVGGLNQEMSRLRHDNMRMEAMVAQREEESDALRKQLEWQLKRFLCQKTKSSSKIKNLKKEAFVEQEPEAHQKEVTQEKTTEKQVEISSHDESRNKNLIVLSHEKGFEEEKQLVISGYSKHETLSRVEIDGIEKLPSPSQPLIKVKNSPPWRTDLNALGVSYKVKRLKQQLVMLERFAGKRESEESNDGEKKAFISFMCLLNKQVGRYQSLQEKTDDLCKRMHDNDLDRAAKTKGEAKSSLEHFLEETFQLQRYIVATGQKLMEIQSKITPGFTGILEELEDKSSSSSFDIKRFAESIGTLFQEVQRGLEVRISRIIGDLEGTLACEGMIHMKRR